MFFKRIEFVGFKSFAAKTTVELLPGVTVIVGPNGCGKSNILDAIKWVLGDQSPKSMRGKHMQDVIFAGSASFKPLGLAQVTLTLDNTSRLLDMDFDEIQITRRLFRTGESEYLLNKVPCRLRDIHNLFLGTGIGMASYSILEQGRVDRIINAKPVDRRMLFEEAAGISKYKVRKIEALRKLERTAEDLKRLNDLVIEVERQVASLKRQASKAERYKEVSGQLKRAEMELLVLRSSGSRTELAELEGAIAQLRDRLEAMRADLARHSANEEAGRAKAENVEGELTRKNQELFEIKTGISDREHQAERLRDKIDAEERRRAQIEAELAELAGREAELADRRRESEERLAQAKSDAAAAETNFADRKRVYEELEAGVREKSGRIETLGREMMTRRDDLSRCENEIRIAEALIERHEESRREIEQDYERLAAALAGHEARKAELEGRLTGVEARLKEKREALGALQLRHAETHGRIADLSSRLEATRQELHQAEARLATLEELKANFEGYLQGVREVMRAARAGELTGIIGPLADHLASRREYEPALEAALGEQLQAILAEDGAAARGAIEYLAQRALGNATFWGLAGVREPAAPEGLAAALAEEGALGHAPALLNSEARLAPVLKAMLGAVVLTRDFDAAARLAEKYPGISFAALDGRVIHATGAMSGGSANAANLLSREREIHELKDHAQTLRAAEGTLREQIAAEREAAQQLNGEIQAGTNETQALKIEKAELEKEAQATGRIHADAFQSAERRRTQALGIGAEIEAKRQAITENEARLGEHAARLATLEEEIALARDAAQAQSDDIRLRGAELAEAHVELERVRERLSHLEAGAETLGREAAALAADRRGREAEAREIEEGRGRSRGEIDRIAEELERQFARKAELEDRLLHDQAEKERLALELKELSHRLEQVQRDERAAENEMHERQVRFAEVQAGLNMMSEQSREKFGLELLALAGEIGEVAREAAELDGLCRQAREQIDRMGPVNLAALDEYQEQKTRFDFLLKQQTDLAQAKGQIEESIATIDETTKKLFHETFETVRGHFIEMFRRLFNGGKADLVIEQDLADPLLDGGVEILAQPPGKKLQTITLMSGGEKAMTAIALLFALFLHKPAPFAVLDEIDAPLDDANVERFKRVVADFAQNTQFVIISHNKQTMALADAIYGVTMEETGVSKLVSVKFEHAEAFATA